jgi:hypothetical protein
VPRAKIWLKSVECEDHRDFWDRIRVGGDLGVGVVSGRGRVWVESFGARTTVHGRLVGMEWHALVDGEERPGRAVESTADEVAEAEDYVYELTVATQDWLPG